MVLRIGLLLLVVPGLTMMSVYFNELSVVDSCLSTGGFYDYVRELCDPTQNHPFVPFMMRFPLLVNGGMLLSVVGLFLCLAGLYTRAR